ncbi:MAG: DUF1080 domain-containing protein [Bacteroidota bacterium]
MKKTVISTAIFFCGLNFAAAQNTIANRKTFIFSAIKGTVSKPDSILLPPGTTAVTIYSGDTASFKILSYRKNKLILAFTPAKDFTGITKAKLQVKNSSAKSILVINLAGLSTNGLEGENEPTLATVADVLGYSVNVGWSTLANNSLPPLQGDELPYSLFRKAGKGKVEIVPVARYSPDFELPFGYYIDTAEIPEKHQVGVLAKAGSFPEHQCLFPALSSGSNAFDPGNRSFGFYFSSPTHSAWSEDAWNMLFFPANAVHATRIYPLKDSTGKLISNTYLLCYEEAKNGDYNDYVFVVKNITPVTNDNFTVLFNGKNLNGWHTFLKGPGVNADPNKNFLIEEGVLHVVGQDLGYAITDKGYSNFHFKVDFKWGERRWGSRTKEKRDAGVCYNIPMNEPDSIWPQSIECQVQEGDVGDFWLLGFSTIKVNGVQNVPANHTRMIKQKDAEKPFGEWNTLEIISYNGKAVHIVNGVVVNIGEEASVKNGRILLQSEYAEIYYRDVKIRKL